jgi:hypothetical protein
MFSLLFPWLLAAAAAKSPQTLHKAPTAEDNFSRTCAKRLADWSARISPQLESMPYIVPRIGSRYLAGFGQTAPTRKTIKKSFFVCFNPK